MSEDAGPPRPVQFEADTERIIAHRRIAQRHGRGRPRIELNLTAMIDVVFLLLIYFLVATKFKLGEEIYRLDIPERQASERIADPFELDQEPLRIRVASLPGLDYRIQLDGPYPQPADFETLHLFLEQRRIADDRLGGLFESDHPVIIEAAPTTRWEHAVEAFSVGVRAGYTNITFGSAL